MNDLAVKEVEFLGDSLLATQDRQGIIWAGVSYICNGIGFSKSQKDTQVLNVQTDEVISRGCLKFQAGVFDPNNETIALRLDYIPLWLAKISITPRMKEETPQVVEKLINYQLKAKNVLAQAFLSSQQFKAPSTYKEALKELLVQVEENEKLEVEKERLEVELDYSKQWYTIKRVASINKVKWTTFDWQPLKDMSFLMGYEIRKIFDANYKSVNAYHCRVWKAVYPQYRL